MHMCMHTHIHTHHKHHKERLLNLILLEEYKNSHKMGEDISNTRLFIFVETPKKKKDHPIK